MPLAATILLFMLLALQSMFSTASPLRNADPRDQLSLSVPRDSKADHALPRHAARTKAVTELRFAGTGKDGTPAYDGPALALLSYAHLITATAGSDGQRHDFSRPVLEIAAGHHIHVRAPPAHQA
ncbi:hypothetical protein [Pararhizobium sp.]|uniref:hypothetical protein n=1 Tax=Pararhizobium sp. TaxID=1977563 RepID=UPI00271AAE2A|nr:hypothetical protein [Pararhizobium sp.]MDO9418464.1 hypothetical protein [Pararhizobium sp.]